MFPGAALCSRNSVAITITARLFAVCRPPQITQYSIGKGCALECPRFESSRNGALTRRNFSRRSRRTRRHSGRVYRDVGDTHFKCEHIKTNFRGGEIAREGYGEAQSSLASFAHDQWVMGLFNSPTARLNSFSCYRRVASSLSRSFFFLLNFRIKLFFYFSLITSLTARTCTVVPLRFIRLKFCFENYTHTSLALDQRVMSVARRRCLSRSPSR